MIRPNRFLQASTLSGYWAALRTRVGGPAKRHPLGPLVRRARADRPWVARCWAGLILGGCLALLLTAANLHPDVAGLGTHRQLGLLPCSMPLLTGYPCPTCGMTTAFAHTVRGSFLSALAVQPAGFLFALMTIGIGVCSALVLVTGTVWRLNWYRINPVTLAMIAGGLVLAAWVFKIAEVALAGRPVGMMSVG